MIRATFIVIVAALWPLAASAQETAPDPRLRVRTADGAVVTVPTGLHARHPAYALKTVRLLGGVIAAEGQNGATVVLLGDTVRVNTSSPFIAAGGHVYQMAWPVYYAEGELYLPRQFFTRWIPARYAGQLTLRDGILEPSSAESAGPAERVVIIDPGHGGRDPGRPGPHGLDEKQIVLMLSKEFGKVLRERGYEVHLTRTKDTLIALSDRPHMANELKAGRPASVFISIHANAHNDPDVRGFETYFLSEARTDDELRVAEMENAAVVYEERTHQNIDDALGHVMNNLRNNYYVRASNDLAEAIQTELAEVHPAPDRGVKQAPFRVLVGAFMPAVLVETAFLSNRRGAELLASAGFREGIAVALADAIDRFFSTHAYLAGRSE